MKKTLIALAALAATGAFAQNVTVYGRLDAGYAQTTTSTTAAGVTTDTKANGVQSHNSVSSMWGLKGTEDLGGGMNAFFVLEQDIYPANGTVGQSGANGGTSTAAAPNPANGFNRTSLVGVNGGFGSISFGRDYNAVFKLIGATDVNSLSRISTVQGAANIGGSTIANMVMYSSPNMGGFTLNVNYGNQDTSGAADAKNKTQAITGVYANGPLMVGIGAGNVEVTAGTAVTKTEGTALGASYDFGKFKLAGNYITTKATAAAGTTVEGKEYNLGVVVPMGKVSLIGQIGRNTATGDTGGNTDTSGNDFVVGVDYALSARTALFAKTGTYNKSSGTSAGDTTFDTKQTSTAIGIKTTF